MEERTCSFAIPDRTPASYRGSGVRITKTCSFCGSPFLVAARIADNYATCSPDHKNRKPLRTDGLRTCSSCRLDKPLEAFDRNSANRSGYHNRCKICRRGECLSDAAKAYQRRYRREHRDERNEALRAWNEAH